MTPQEFIGVARIALDESRLAEVRGAARMRRRIRAKQAKHLHLLSVGLQNDHSAWGKDMKTALGKLDAATRSAPRKGRAK